MKTSEPRSRQAVAQRQEAEPENKSSKTMAPPPFQLKAEEAEDKAKTEKGAKKDIKVTIASDVESEFLSSEYVAGNVGHSWVKVDEPGKAQDSYGFWPANLGNGGGFDPSRPWKSVAGEVRHPDTSHTAKQEMSVQTDSASLAEGIKYAGEKASVNYNLLTYNCTTFARQFFKKATGESAPSAGFLGLAENPNFLANGIEKRNAKDAKKAQKQEEKTKRKEEKAASKAKSGEAPGN